VIQLRDYQTDLLERARAKMRQGKRRILLQLPTGGGKTAIAWAMMHGAERRGLRTNFLVHRRELIKQTSASLTEYGLGHGFIAPGWAYNPHATTVLSSVPTLQNRLGELVAPDVAIPDECHHMAAASWSRMSEAWPNAYWLGLTATPQRLDGRGLREYFDDMVMGPSTAELIKRGFLSPYEYFAPGTPDLVGCRTSGGDFNRRDIADLMNNPRLIGDVVEHYLRLAKGERGIVFGVDRAHSQSIADCFCAHGVRAVHVDGETGEKERDRADAALRAGDIDIVCNVELFGEGYDVPGIGYLGMARPTKSLSWYRQMVGRVLRIFPGKEVGIIADHAGNAFQHGMPDDHIEWSLDGVNKKKLAVDREAYPIRACPECYRISSSMVKVCPGCGYEHQTVARPVQWEEGELFKLDRVAAKNREAEDRKAEERACKTVGELIELARRRGYPKPVEWATMKIEMRSKRFHVQKRFARRR
jgi:DNA repair protein RadD